MGESHVSPPPLIIPLLVGVVIGLQEHQHHAYAHSHSPHDASVGLSTHHITSLFISSQVSWVKRFHIPLQGVRFLFCLTDCWIVSLLTLPLPHGFDGCGLILYGDSCRVLCLFPCLSNSVLSYYFHRWNFGCNCVHSSLGCIVSLT